MRHFADSPREAACGSKTRAAIWCVIAGFMLSLALSSCVPAAHTARADQKAVKQTSGSSRNAEEEATLTTINAPHSSNASGAPDKTASGANASKTAAQTPETAQAKTPDKTAAGDTPSAAEEGKTGTPTAGAETKTDAPAANAGAKTDIPGEQRPPATWETTTTVRQPADFNECVRVALVQSPLFVKSTLEIQSKRLDVQDAWSEFIPTLSLSTTYWFVLPKAYYNTVQTVYDPATGQNDITKNVQVGTQTQKPYTISFNTGQWNPILAGFDVAAKKEMVSMAILGHLRVISDGLHRLAADFLQLEAVTEQQAIVGKKVELAKSNLEFFKTRQGLGQATDMEIRMAETKITMAKAEADSVNAQRAQIMNDIKFILGVPFVDKLDLDVANAKQEILGSFGTADVTDDKVRAHSFDLRTAEYEKSLQHKNIGLSYVRLIPSFGFTFQSLDAFVSSTQQVKGQFPFYPGINITMPLDYWTKGRDIARQYTKLDQQQANTKAKVFELMVTAQRAMTDYQSANSDSNLASSRSELARLQNEQTEISYKAGQADFDKVMADRTSYYESQQNMLAQKTKRDLALLALKDLTGDLQKQYIDVTSWEK